LGWGVVKFRGSSVSRSARFVEEYRWSIIAVLEDVLWRIDRVQA
jgi:hypothetical protein